MRNIIKKVSPIAVAFLMLMGCSEDYLETMPTAQIAETEVLKTTQGAYVALDGVYRYMFSSLTNHGNFGQKSQDLVMDLMGNDMVVHSAGYGWFNTDYQYTAQQSAASSSRSERAWEYYYSIIDNSNRILAAIDVAVGPQEDRDNIKGQALALRAHSYFYLINLFQHTYVGNESAPGVPLYTEPTTEGKPRGTVQEVYTQILSDLKAAEALLLPRTNKLHNSHINAKTVKGIWARVALQMEDYATAAVKANEARQGYTLMNAATYQAGFSKYNSEWMWGSIIGNDQATIYASFFSHVDVSSGGYAALGTQKKITKELYDIIPAGDVRKTVFRTPGTGTATYPDYTSIKFRLPVSGSWEGDYVLMRASEMYLIEAEALVRTGSTTQAETVMETLGKARLATYDAPSEEEALLEEILLQRRIELWGEGFSLLDIKRLNQGVNRTVGAGNHDAGLALAVTIPAEDPRFLYRIPQDEINANDFIDVSDQNP